MKKWGIRIGLVFMLAFSVIIGWSASGQADGEVASATPGLPTITVTVPGNTITIPGPVVEVPGPRVTLPRQTVVKVIKVPVPMTTTQFVKVPSPVRTEYVTLPRRTVTKTAVIRQTATVTATMSETQTVTATQTVTPPTITKTETVIKTRTVKDDGVITVERVKAVGISLGLLLLGGLIALLAMYVSYAVGYKDSELDEEKRAESLLTEIFSRKR